MKPTGITPTLTAAMVFGLAQTVNAADGTYTSQAGAWNVETSWSDGTIADGTDSTAFFTNDVTTSNRTTPLGEDRTIGHIVFTDADNTAGFNRTISTNTIILTFDVTSGSSTIDVTQSNRQLIFDSRLSGNDGLKLTGPGLIRFNNSNNNYSGGTESNAGTLWLAATGAAGSGTISLGNTTGSDNAELRMSNSSTTITNPMEVREGSSGTKTLANRATNTVIYSGTITANDDLAILLAGTNGGSVFTVSGAGNSIAAGKAVTFADNPAFTTIAAEKSLIFTGDASLGANRTLTVDTGSTVNTAFVEFSGVISGSGFGITKAGAGSLVLSGTNTYTGETTVNAGVLALTGSSIANTGKLIVNGGTVDLTNTETVDTLFLAATQQPAGDYSASSVPSGATITIASFSGSGTLTVLTSATTFADWISDPAFGIAPADQDLNDDPDGDGIDNGVENFFGTEPGVFSQGLVAGTASGNTFTFTHPVNASPASDLTPTYRWSKDLVTFTPSGGTHDGTTVTITPGTPSGGFVTVTAEADTPTSRLFVDVQVTQP